MGMEVAEKIGFGLIAVGTGGEREIHAHIKWLIAWRHRRNETRWEL